jgi:hypothetical protein
MSKTLDEIMSDDRPVHEQLRDYTERVELYKLTMDEIDLLADRITADINIGISRDISVDVITRIDLALNEASYVAGYLEASSWENLPENETSARLRRAIDLLTLALNDVDFIIETNAILNEA